MKIKILIYICLFLIAIIQSTVLTVFFAGRTVPNLILVLVVFFSARRGLDRGIALAVSSGLVLDIFSFWPIGLNVLILVIVSYLASSFSKRFLIQEGIFSCFMITGMLIGAIIFQETLLSAISLVAERISSVGLYWPMGRSVLGEVALKIVWSVAIFVSSYPIIRKVDKLFFGPARNIYMAR